LLAHKVVLIYARGLSPRHPAVTGRNAGNPVFVA